NAPTEASLSAPSRPPVRPDTLPLPGSGSSAPAAVAKPHASSRGRWLAAVIVVGLLLLGIAAALFLSERSGKREGGSESAESGGRSTSGEGLPLDQPIRKDFGLTVQMLGGKPGPGGDPLLEEGQEVDLRIRVERDAYVGIWTIDARGTVTQLFPNS